MGRGVENYAVPMHKIVQKIHDNFPFVNIGEGNSGGDNGGGALPINDFEPNNSLATAASVTASFSKSLAITTTTDNDYFKFKYPSAGKISVKVTFSHSNGDIDVRLINGSKKIVNKSVSSTDNESMSYTTTKAGIYYVKVYGYKGAKGKYKIEVTFKKKVVDNAPNDSFKTATEISFPTKLEKIISTSKDLDFYTFTVSKKTKFAASLKFTHSNGDLDLYLLDANEKVIDKSTSVKSTESMSRTLTAGKYYVVVLGYKGAKGSYTLDMK
jgi:hypothetical protein